ncbi:hypothetical protein KKH15_02565 [Patescibacteria group bacterium]|nr:hypothetical protein [Patescibacteria group bacterium]MBU1754731.1 hypothetical protein [Patescibacteria group bacterium]
MTPEGSHFAFSPIPEAEPDTEPKRVDELRSEDVIYLGGRKLKISAIDNRVDYTISIEENGKPVAALHYDRDEGSETLDIIR